jgi:hypothetical protein
MEGMDTEFFQSLYTRQEHVGTRAILDFVQGQVDEATNGKLCAPFTEREIGDALFQIGPLTLGPDVFPACFMQCN